MRRFLEGAWSIDDHFHTAPLDKNLPVRIISMHGVLTTIVSAGCLCGVDGSCVFCRFSWVC